MRDMEEYPLEIHGAWVVILCKLWWSETRGEATKTLDEWTRILREKKKKTEKILHFLHEKNIANVHFLDNQNPNQNVTITSRRMVKDYEISLLRQRVGKLGGNPGLKKIKENGQNLDNQNESKTTSLPFPSPFPSPKKKNNKKKKQIDYPKDFELFWEQYPIKKSKDKSYKSWVKLSDDGVLPPHEKMVKSILDQVEEVEYKKKNNQWVAEFKLASTWLNGHCWNDEVVLHDKQQETFAPEITTAADIERNVYG